jgi:rhomboid family protein
LIPIADASRRPAHIPAMTYLLIAANLVVFFFELSEGNRFITHWALIPARIAHQRDYVTLLTAMFMHAGWLHILGNMLFLWVFGPAVEDIMGAAKYLIFYLLGGMVASVAQIVIDPNSTVANLGASGAIAAVMGAFLINFPRDRIRTVLILGIFVDVTTLPAVVLIGVWFVLQLLSQLLVATGGPGIAFMAHIAGFIFGAAAAPFFRSFNPARRERV